MRSQSGLRGDGVSAGVRPSFVRRGLRRPVLRAADVHGSEEHLSGTGRLREDQDLDPDPEPDRDPEELVRALPADARAAAASARTPGCSPCSRASSRSRDLRENCSLEFVEYSIGNWECKCGRLVGLDKLGRPCTFCAATIITDPRGDREIHCPKCGHLNENTPVTCETCDEPVGLKLKYDVDECQERGMTFAVPLKVTIRLVVWDKDPETGAKTHPRHQGAGGLLRRHPADDGERDLHHQRHRARHRQPAAPLAGRLLLAAGEGPVRGADHPVPRQLGGVRVRLQEPAARAHRPQAQVPGLGLPARAGPEDRRRDPEAPSTRPTASTCARAGCSGRSPTNLVGPEAVASRSTGPRTRSGQARGAAARGQEDHGRACSQQMQKLEVEEVEITEADLEGAFTRRRHRGPAHGRGGARGATSRSRRACSPWCWTPRAARSAPSRCSSPSATRSARCCR